MITKINTINVFFFFLLNENLNIMFLHQEGYGSRRGGWGGNQNKDIDIAIIFTIHFAFRSNLTLFKGASEGEERGR